MISLRIRTVRASFLALPWREGFEPAPDGLLRVGNLGGLLVVMEVEVELGDIDSDIDFHGGNVYSSTGDTNSIGSRNCSS